MRRSCNLCGKRALLWQEHLIHGTSCYDLCRKCEKYLKRLGEQDHYEAARKYLETKMQQGRNERINFILRNRMRNLSIWKEPQLTESESDEDNGTAGRVKSIGALGGGVMFLLGICMLNIHFQIAVQILLLSVLFGGFVYGTGIMISFVLNHLQNK